MKQLFIYDPENPRRERVLELACDAARQRGRTVTLLVDDPKKSREQEQHYHALIGDIARQRTIYDKKRPAETWKRLLIDAFRHDTLTDPEFAGAWSSYGGVELVPALNNDGFVQVGEQSRSFSKKLAAGFIEWLYAYGAEAEVVWSAPRKEAA
jgi:hypothetical protein